MIAFLLAAMAIAVPYSILGEGNTTCGEWIDRRREQPDRVLPEAAWVSGYITAAARDDSARNNREIARGLPGNASDHWIDNYCAAHPLDKIEEAASSLVAELIARSHR